MDGIFVKILSFQRMGNLCKKHFYLFNYKPFVFSLFFLVLIIKKKKKRKQEIK